MDARICTKPAGSRTPSPTDGRGRGDGLGRRRWLASLAPALSAVVSCSVSILPGTPDGPGRDSTDITGEDGGRAASDGGSDAVPNEPEAATYANPVFGGDFPDPFVLRDGDRYYAFATNVAGKNVPVLTSTRLAQWDVLPDALPNLPAWAKSNASLTWAPSVLKRGASFVLYFTARHVASNFQCIGRAISANPAGPYVDDSGGPFVCQVAGTPGPDPMTLCGSIDASPFIDENGDAYLLWKSDDNAAECDRDARLWTQRLGVDGISLLGEPTELLRRDRTWERPLIEGPSMVKIDGRYLLFYSANWWESAGYGVGWASCSSPVGPCTKPSTDGPLIGSGGAVLGPGGQEFFTDPSGKTWMAYHGWTSPKVGYGSGGARSLRIDPITFPSGVPTLAGPSTTTRPL